MKKIIGLLLSVALVLSVGCAKEEVAANKFEGSAKGYHAETPIKVAVEFNEKEIKSIEVLEQAETAGLGDAAIDTVIAAIIDGQTLEVDTVAGATYSSNGVKAAVAAAMAAAELDAAEYGYVEVEGKPEILDPSELIKEVESTEEGYRAFEYTTDGTVCSDRITFSIKEDDLTVHSMVVYNGCDGTSKGFSILADTMTIDYCVERLGGILCDYSQVSSCPDQCAKALAAAQDIILGNV